MTLEILNLQVSEITIRVGQTMEGQKIRVLIREVADLESAIIDRVVDAVASSTDIYINGLEEWVKYILQVATYDAATYDPENPEAYLAYDEKIFTTKRVGAVRDGQLIKMPVLPPNFALFNWDDWPTSRSALVSGGMTHEFQRGCWNSIVDTLYNAFMDAGLHWWGDLVEGGLKAEDTKILLPYDGLYAYKINALLDEIYRKAKFPFVWENDRNFRGYVGRRHFVGVSEVGEEADLVYPEYILELVRRLNLLLQIMRGWGPELEQIASSNILTSTEVNRKIEWGLAAPFAKEEAVSVDYIEPPGRGGISGVLETDPQGMAAEYSAKMDKGKRRPFSGTEGTITRTKSVNIPQSKGVAATPGAASGKTDYTGDKFSSIKVSPLPQTVGQAASRVRSLRILSGIPRWVVFNADTIASDGTAAPDSGYAMLTYPRGFAGVSEAAEIAGAPEGRACGRGYSATRPATSFGLKKNVPVAVGEKSASKATAAIGTAWLPPVWIDGGLWIRQSHSVTKNENGELVIT